MAGLQPAVTRIRTERPTFPKLPPVKIPMVTARPIPRKPKPNTILPLRIQRAKSKMPLLKLRTVKSPLHFPMIRL